MSILLRPKKKKKEGWVGLGWGGLAPPPSTHKQKHARTRAHFCLPYWKNLFGGSEGTVMVGVIQEEIVSQIPFENHRRKKSKSPPAGPLLHHQ